MQTQAANGSPALDGALAPVAPPESAGPFRILARCPATRARRGQLRLPHAVVETPVFMPVGTQATVKTLTSEDVEAMGFRLILSNTYHLHLRPGDDRIAKLGGLHSFMSWPHGILTDSGGYQVFSLESLRKISEEGVRFASHIDGKKINLTPERSIEIQLNLGSDVVMAFDECIPFPAQDAYVVQATARSFRWTLRSLDHFRREDRQGRLFFGIVQGGMTPAQRRWSAQAIGEIAPDGLAIGGLSVGEPKPLMAEMLDVTVPLLAESRPRYLMGVGTPLDLVKAVAAGMDMFDCVLPTRVARHGHVYTSEGRLNVINARHRDDPGPLDPACRCVACRRYSRAYLHHLFKAEESLGGRLTTLHNLHYYGDLMHRIRLSIPAGTLPGLVNEIEALQARGSAAGDKH